MVEFVKPADDGFFQHDAEGSDNQRCQDEAGEIADPEVVQQHPGHKGAHHEQRAMGEVDDVQHAEDDGEAKRQAGVE